MSNPGDEVNKRDYENVKNMSTSPTQGSRSVLSRLFSFSPSKSDVPSPTSSNIQEPPCIYYGVYIPCDLKTSIDEELNDGKTLHVYTDRNEALKVVKKYKRARFKALGNRQEAVAFALRGAETLSHDNTDQPINSILQVAPSFNPMIGEKTSQFRGPKPQEMVQFRKFIEAGDIATVGRMVWENPRYLVSSGDTPSILQEGSRYNALHYAVKTNNPDMCDFLLSTISDVQFMQLLFADDNQHNSKRRAEVLLDLYLNMPDKAMNETPLHFASKLGAKDIVDLLVSYPQCNTTLLNKFGDQPKDIICQRAKVSGPKLIEDIRYMLKERFYVPVLHSEDSSSQPVIGEPFTPASPPLLNNDPLSPRVEIRAFAGPMERGEAVNFRRKWKTPPRGTITSTSTTTPQGGIIASPRFRLQDVHKGLERVGRDLAQRMKVGWREYWPFLDTFTDLTSQEGLTLLENYLKEKYISQWNNSTNSVILSDTDHIFSQSNLTLEKKKDTPLPLTFTQKISFSPSRPSRLSGSDNGLSPMSDLCMALDSCSLNDHRTTKYRSDCNKLPTVKLSNQQTIQDENIIANLFLNPGLSPYLYVEKSCLVFAKRITLGLTHALTTEQEMVFECLKTETKHLQQTIASFMDDPRFYTVDFHLIHSRVAQLIAQKLMTELKYNDDLDLLKQSLKDITYTNSRIDMYSSDEDESFISYRACNRDDSAKENKNKMWNSQISCMAGSILQWIIGGQEDERERDLKTEEECINVWADVFKCRCTWQTEQTVKNHRKSASLKRSQIKARDQSQLSTSPNTTTLHDLVSRRLHFDHNDEDVGDVSEEIIKSDKNHNIPNEREEHDVLLEEENDSSDKEDIFLTPLSSVSPEFLSSDESDYEDVEDAATVLHDPTAIDVYIYGCKASKMDKLVYEAISECDIDKGIYPYLYRWRHATGLFSQQEMESWPQVFPDNSDDEVDNDCLEGTPVRCSLRIGPPPSSSTPSKPLPPSSAASTPPPLQVSKWMRVTGPNTPRRACTNKNFRPNVSFGF